MMILTKERPTNSDLRELSEFLMGSYSGSLDTIRFAIAAGAISELIDARQLLASMEQEPVAWRYRTTDINGNPNQRWSFSEEESLMGLYQPLYAAPQLPQPAVADEDDNFYSWFGREWHENYQHNQYTTAAKQMLGVMAESAWRAGRIAAMLHGAEPVQGWIPCSERMPERDYVLAADFSGAYYLPSLPNTQVGIYADWFEDGNPSWDEGDGNDLHLKQVTHWMPMPAAPQQEAEPVQAAPEGWVPCSPEWIERNGPCSCAEAPRIAFGSIGNHYHPHIYHNPKHEERP